MFTDRLRKKASAKTERAAPREQPLCPRRESITIPTSLAPRMGAPHNIARIAIAVSTAPGPAPLQLVKLSRPDHEDIWEKLAEFHEDWDSFDTADLTPESRAKLVVVLRTEKKSVLADEVEREKPVKVDMPKITGRIKFEEPLVHAQSNAPYIKPPDVNEDQPEDEAMRNVWVNAYKKAAKEYTGLPKDIEETVIGDPAIKLLFTPPSIFLEIIGWKTMSEARDVDPTVRVELKFFQKNSLTVGTSFPNGMQDTTLRYTRKDDKYSVTEVYRHRSMKTESAPPNTFYGMIREQASGVAKLGEGVHYYSKAIKDESSGAFGYNVWPKMGFDADVPQVPLQKMLDDGSPAFAKAVAWMKERALKGPVTFSDMFTVEDSETYKQLKELWRTHGDTVEVAFDTAKESPSWKALDRYEKSRDHK
jgi:hypothetical protein